MSGWLRRLVASFRTFVVPRSPAGDLMNREATCRLLSRRGRCAREKESYRQEQSRGERDTGKLIRAARRKCRREIARKRRSPPPPPCNVLVDSSNTLRIFPVSLGCTSPVARALRRGSRSITPSDPYRAIHTAARFRKSVAAAPPSPARRFFWQRESRDFA